MIEFVAFVVVLAQLVCVSEKKIMESWVLCLIACALYVAVAAERHMLWLGIQQVVIAGVAIRGFYKS